MRITFMIIFTALVGISCRSKEEPTFENEDLQRLYNKASVISASIGWTQTLAFITLLLLIVFAIYLLNNAKKYYDEVKEMHFNLRQETSPLLKEMSLIGASNKEIAFVNERLGREIQKINSDLSKEIREQYEKIGQLEYQRKDLENALEKYSGTYSENLKQLERKIIFHQTQVNQYHEILASYGINPFLHYKSYDMKIQRQVWLERLKGFGVEDVISEIEKHLNNYKPEFKPELFALSSRFSNITKAYASGQVNRADHDIEINQITNALVGIINKA